MDRKKQEPQTLIISSNDEIINSLSLEEINELLNEPRATFIEDLYLRIEDTESSCLLAE